MTDDPFHWRTSYVNPKYHAGLDIGEYVRQDANSSVRSEPAYAAADGILRVFSDDLAEQEEPGHSVYYCPANRPLHQQLHLYEGAAGTLWWNGTTFHSSPKQKSAIASCQLLGTVHISPQIWQSGGAWRRGLGDQMTLTDAQYERVAPLLPTPRGKLTIPQRQVLDALFYIAKEGCTWPGLPDEFGHWRTFYMRLNRWAKAGVLERVVTGRPALIMDRAYHGNETRQLARDLGYLPVVPPPSYRNPT